MDLLKEINNINDLTSQEKIREIRHKISVLNIHDEQDNYIYKQAKLKGII